MKLPKSLKKLSGDTNLLLMVVGGAILVYFIYSYSRQKNTDTSRFTQNNQLGGSKINGTDEEGPAAALDLGQNSGPASANGSYTNEHGLPPNGLSQTATDPKQLLPNSNDGTNTNNLGELGDINLLKAGTHIGIDTVGQSLRNANLQLRSEPANPKISVGPWNQSTIEGDTQRRSLEIGGN
jgi:hypothetical protein